MTDQTLETTLAAVLVAVGFTLELARQTVAPLTAVAPRAPRTRAPRRMHWTQRPENRAKVERLARQMIRAHKAAARRRRQARAA